LVCATAGLSFLSGLLHPDVAWVTVKWQREHLGPQMLTGTF